MCGACSPRPPLFCASQWHYGITQFRPIVREELPPRGIARSRQDGALRRTQYGLKNNRRHAKCGGGKHMEANNRGAGSQVQGDRQQRDPQAITQKVEDIPRTGSQNSIAKHVAEQEMASDCTTTSQAFIEQEGRDGAHRLSNEPQSIPSAGRRVPSPSDTRPSAPTKPSSFTSETLDEENDTQNKVKHCCQHTTTATATASAGTSSSPLHPLPPPPAACPTSYHVASCMCELCRRARAKRKPGPPTRPTFKIVGPEPTLVSATLEAHGFKRGGGKNGRGARRGKGTGSTPWRILWSSQHLRRGTL